MTHQLASAVLMWGYAGIFFAMLLESACIPLPSEVIMPFGGFLAAVGHFNFWAVVGAGTAGNMVGSLLTYWLGRSGGRRVLLRYGGYLGLHSRHLAQAEEWFHGRGEISVLIGRVLPIVRTFISLPAGLGRMSVSRFVIYTAMGSLPWVYVLTWAGSDLGHNWKHVAHFANFLSILVVAAVLFYIVSFLRRRGRAKGSEVCARQDGHEASKSEDQEASCLE